MPNISGKRNVGLVVIPPDDDTGGGGSGTVTDITATPPIQVTPSPITVSGDIEHLPSGVTSGTYGDATHVAQVAVDVTGHTTAASNVLISGLGPVGDHLLLIGQLDTLRDDVDSFIQVPPPKKLLPGSYTPWLWGTGRDGSLHFDGTNTFSFADKTGNTYWIKRSVHATDCIIDSGITVRGWDQIGSKGGGLQLYCQLTLTCNGILGGLGLDGGLTVGGRGSSVLQNMYGNSGDGGSGGGGGSAGGNGANSSGWGGSGGAGGASSPGTGTHAGGAGGTATAPSIAESAGDNLLYNPDTAIYGRFTQQGSPFWLPEGGGAGGGGGGGKSSVSSGGGAGSGGSPFLVSARFIALGSGHISCDGGNGAPPVDTPEGGGGGGGGGGILWIMTTTVNFASLVSCTANGGLGGVTGGLGTNGSNGAVGRLIPIIIP